LDLTITRGKEGYSTKTHQKQLNLYLYPTFNSAHPPGVYTGLIYGLLKKYKNQNSDESNFKLIASNLFKRLLNRGFRYVTLKRMFLSSLHRLNMTSKPRKRKRNSECQHFFKVPYDPNGPTRKQLREMYDLNKLSTILEEENMGKITICYKRPQNLGNIVMRTNLTDGGANPNNTGNPNATGYPNTTGNSNSTGNSNPTGNSNSTGNPNATENSNSTGNPNATGNSNSTGNPNPTGNYNSTGNRNQIGNPNNTKNPNTGIPPADSGYCHTGCSGYTVIY
jgi:hypothetical protein